MKNKLGCVALLGVFLSSTALAGTTFIPIIIPSTPVRINTRQVDYSRFHTFAVVSAIGMTLTIHANQILGSIKHLDISDWKVDDSVSAAIRTHMGNGFTFVDTSYDRNALAQIPNGPWNNSTGALRKFLQPLQGSADAFIVVRPDLERNAPGYPGLVFQNGTAMSSSRVILWANYEIDVIDAKTFETIAKAYSLDTRAPPDIAPFAGALLGPGLKLDDDALNPTQRQLSDLRVAAENLVSESLSGTLDSISLHAKDQVGAN